MLQPKRTKYRKRQKGRIKGLAQRGNMVAFGTYGIKALEPGFVTARQIEASRIVMSKLISKTNSKMWIRVFPDKPISRKPEGRMGNGKGNVEFWASVIKPGRILFEMEEIPFENAQKICSRVSDKLPFKVKLIWRKDYLCSC